MDHATPPPRLPPHVLLALAVHALVLAGMRPPPHAGSRSAPVEPPDPSR